MLGLEVHVELNTATKMFCGCPTEFGAEPNTQVCPVCLGLPGALPVVNAQGGRVGDPDRPGAQLRDRRVVPVRPEELLLPGHAEELPDLASTTSRSPSTGYLDVELEDGTTYRVEIERAHMEEDTGKSLHVGGATGRIHGADYSLVDYNRAGIPLIEIVTKPIAGAGERAPEVARAYVAQLRDLLRGARRLRRPDGAGLAALRRQPVAARESPKGSRRAARHPHRDQERQLAALGRAGGPLRDHAGTRRSSTGGGSILQETRHWHEDTGVTTRGREKSDAEDYRYFPEPDLVPVAPDARVGRASCAARCPSRPPSGARRLQADWGFTDLEMRDVVDAGALELVEETVAAGATPAGGPQVVARRAGPPRQRSRASSSPTSASRRPHVAELAGAGRRRAGSTTSWPARCSTACSPARAPRRGRRRPRARRRLRRRRARRGRRHAPSPPTPTSRDKIRDGKVAAAGALIGAVMKEMRGQADAAGSAS